MGGDGVGPVSVGCSGSEAEGAVAWEANGRSTQIQTTAPRSDATILPMLPWCGSGVDVVRRGTTCGVHACTGPLCVYMCAPRTQAPSTQLPEHIL